MNNSMSQPQSAEEDTMDDPSKNQNDWSKTDNEGNKI